MAGDRIEVRITPRNFPAHLAQYNGRLDKEVKQTMDQAMKHVQGSVPEYPAPPPASSYMRTGTLGRTIGQGGGRPTIYHTERLGVGDYEGHVGTNLDYARYVIGTDTQAWMHRGRWWTMKTVAERATPGVVRLFEAMTKRLASWLGG